MSTFLGLLSTKVNVNDYVEADLLAFQAVTVAGLDFEVTTVS